jgi:hypothetical protein
MSWIEIEKGKIYSNGKARRELRKVLGFPFCPAYVAPATCVRYLVVESWCQSLVGIEQTITLKSFVKWAKREVV